jgi:hypothetical protein
LRLSLADTHRGTLAGAMVLSITPTTFARPRATNVRFDADALGSSDGSRLTRVGPSMRFEFVTDVRVPGDLVSSVESRWSLPKSARALFKSLTLRTAPTVPQGSALFAAGDDLDGETIDEDKWRPLVSNSPGLARWMQAPASGRLWLAMDTTVVLSRSAAPLSASARGPRTPAPATPPLKLPLPSTTVAELVKQFVTLEPHAVPREKVDAIEAASGYEVVFNRSAFMKAYDALLAPPPPPVSTPELPTARYVVRSYLAVPSVVVPRAAPRIEREPEAPPAAATPVSQPVSTKWLQLDVAGGATLFATTGTRDVPNLWDGNTFSEFPSFGVRAFIGPSIVGLIGAHYLGRSAVLGFVQQDFLEISGDLGIGYSFRWERVWVTPSAALLLRHRTHTGLGDVNTLGGIVGVNTRLVLTSWLGLSLDLAVPMSFGGPVAHGVTGIFVNVVGGPGFRSTLGLSLSF